MGSCDNLAAAVGHVLEKVDGRNDQVRIVCKQQFRLWKSDDSTHDIFRLFIEPERNNVLKEYELGISQGPIAVSVTFKDEVTGQLTKGDLNALDGNIYRPISSGPYEGEDGRTLLEFGIEWWEKRLDEIDEIVQELNTSRKSNRPIADSAKQHPQ